MIAVIPVRGGVLPAGSLETISEAGGNVLLVGDGATESCSLVTTSTKHIRAWEAGAFRPNAWSKALAPTLRNEEIVILPSSPDGRDFAPHLAHALGVPLVAGAVRVTDHVALVLVHGGMAAMEIEIVGAVVVTLQPGVREVGCATSPVEHATIESLSLEVPFTRETETLAILPPDPATMDLSEADRIVSGGRGLGSAQAFARLAGVASGLKASLGATRAATDVGWVDPRRFIGVTGTSANPRLYIALGISGAVQHVNGIGRPDHIISVNTDPGCPMMAVADLAVVADAPSVVDELAQRLGAEGNPDG